MKYVCIHGHFYQPPRENPWLESIEPQDSAHPYHDWNERINSECFAPNASCRILDNQQQIVKIVNNYCKMSFNFGPTLLIWLEKYAPGVYRAVLDADRESIETFSGHGSALAQAYNHAILPLATARQKEIQVKWGITDFRRRFGRDPEGFWLPETAVDLKTLEVLAAEGIRFTILAPRQAKGVRRIGDSDWRDVSGSRIDPRLPYLQRLPSGGQLVLFFYNGPVARAVAFEGLLSNGEQFASRLMDSFSEDSKVPQLMHIATDGETYGHHHQFGEMALAYAIDRISRSDTVRITNYGEFLSLNAPEWEVEIAENTSWSCAHGVERWRSDCGCSTMPQPGWNQAWRRPLREAMDLLEEELTPAFEAEAAQFFSEPWNAVYDYANLILDRSNSKVRQFLLQHARRKLNRKETVTALKLLEMQRFLTLSFTSCGWFFDDMAGIETRQILQYAGRTLQLAEEIFQADYEQPFVGVLAAGKSNRTQFGTGRQIYEKWVKEAKVDLLKVGAHYALCSLFDKVEKESSVYVYAVHSEDFEHHRAGRARLSIGKARISSTVTRESTMLTFGVLGMGNHTLVGGVRHFQSEEAYLMFKAELRATLERVDFPEVIRALDRHFGKAVYSLASLFVEEQRRILKTILDSTLSEVEASLSDTYRRHNPLMRYLENQGIPLPEVFGMTAQFVLNTQLRRALKAEEFDPETVRQLLAETASHGIKLDATTLNYHFQTAIEKLATRAFKEQRNRIPMEKLEETIELNRSGPLQANLWKVQNLYYDAMQSLLEANGKKTPSTAWLELFLLLGRKLSVRVSDELKLNQA